MKTYFIFFLCIVKCFILYADGIQEKERQAYEQIQLKIINLTDTDINFYFNRLYHPHKIKNNEEYVTMKTPVNSDYPGFIAIEYNNEIQLYDYTHIGELIPRDDHFWIITIKDENINFFEVTPEQFFEDTIGQNGYNTKKSTSYWYKPKWNEFIITIKIKNNTDKKKIYIYGPYEDVVNMNLDKNETGLYEIDDTLFSLNRKLRILILQDGFLQEISLNNYNHKNILITIIDDGYELHYYEEEIELFKNRANGVGEVFEQLPLKNSKMRSILRDLFNNQNPLGFSKIGY
jgi:hypothetical protein